MGSVLQDVKFFVISCAGEATFSWWRGWLARLKCNKCNIFSGLQRDDDRKGYQNDSLPQVVGSVDPKHLKINCLLLFRHSSLDSHTDAFQ